MGGSFLQFGAAEGAIDDSADTKREELFVAVCTAVAASLLDPRIGLFALVLLWPCCVATSRFAARLLAVASATDHTTDAAPLRASTDARVAGPSIAEDLPQHLLEKVLAGDAVAGSQLRILARLFPDHQVLREFAALVDPGYAPLRVA